VKFLKMRANTLCLSVTLRADSNTCSERL